MHRYSLKDGDLVLDEEHGSWVEYNEAEETLYCIENSLGGRAQVAERENEALKARLAKYENAPAGGTEDE